MFFKGHLLHKYTNIRSITRIHKCILTDYICKLMKTNQESENQWKSSIYKAVYIKECQKW